MKKIVCEYCEEIIEVEDKEETIYCPKCFKEVNVKLAEKRLPIFKDKRFELANTQLNVATEYEKAAQGYKKVLEIEPENFEAIRGLILATLYQSTIRESHIKSTHEIFKSYKSLLELLPEDFDDFINKVNDEVNYYVGELKDRLIDYDHFYEEEGKKLFYETSEEIIDFKKTLVNNVNSKEDKSKIQKEINELRELLKKDFYVESSPFHVLNTTSKEAYIPNTVFKDVRKAFKQRKRFRALFIASFGLMIVGILLIFILSSYLVIGVPIASLGFILTLVFGITYLGIERKLN